MSDHNRSQPLETDVRGRINRSFISFASRFGAKSARFHRENGEKRRQSTTAKESNGQMPISQEFLQQVVQVLPARVAVLDDRGKIVAVNQAWISYCKENGLSVKKFGAGSNYLQLCRKAQCFCRENGPKAAKGIESVMAGHQDSFYHGIRLFIFEQTTMVPNADFSFLSQRQMLDPGKSRKYHRTQARPA